MGKINFRVDDNTSAMLAFISVSTAAALWNANCPSIRDVPATDNSELRLALKKSAVEVGLLAVAATAITKSWWPILAIGAFTAINYGFINYAATPDGS